MTDRLDTGRVFDAIFKIYKAQAGVLIPAALIVFVPVSLISGFARDNGGLLLSLVSFIVTIVGTYWYQGTVVEAVKDIQDGRRDSSLGQLFSSVTPFLGSLIGAGLLAGLGIVLGLIVFIVPGLILLTMWALLSPVIILERTGAMGSFNRSQDLTKGSRWQVFGVIVVLFIINFVVQFVLIFIVAAITSSVVGIVIASLIASLLIAPLSAIAATVMYLELARIKGGGPSDAGGVPAAPDAPDAPAAPAAPASLGGLPGDTSSGLPGSQTPPLTGGSIPPPGIPGS